MARWSGNLFDLETDEENASQNMMVYGDNLLALRHLQKDFSGKIKCVTIDPPYNTGKNFTHYGDNVKRKDWLAFMQVRLELIKPLLSDDGTIWVIIDDHESHRLKILMDEVYGERHFVANVVWHRKVSPQIYHPITHAHDNILVYAKNFKSFKKSANRFALSDAAKEAYRNPDNDERGRWLGVGMTVHFIRPNTIYPMVSPTTGKIHMPNPGYSWSMVEETYQKLLADGRIYFGPDGNGRPMKKIFLSESRGVGSWTWWPHSEAGSNVEAKYEIYSLFGKEDSFDTPKPERLIKRILEIATNPGDLVMDTFAGSGTTGAVAHKMRRHWIMMEMGDHCFTHVIPRLNKVVDGDDMGGISEAVGWHGGGGFKVFKTAEEDGEPLMIELTEIPEITGSAFKRVR